MSTDSFFTMANDKPGVGLSQIRWGIIDGKQVNLYTLRNLNGVEIKITNYGGIVTSWITPDKKGRKSNLFWVLIG